MVHLRRPDLAGQRRRRDVPRRARGAAAPVAAPPRDGRRGRAQRLQGRPVGTVAAHQPLPRDHDLRDRGRRRAGDRARPVGAPPRPRHRRPRPRLRRRRPAPPAVGARRGGAGRFLDRVPVVRRDAAHRRRGRPLRRPDHPRRDPARRDRPAAHGGGARAGDRGLPARAREHPGRPRGDAVHAAQSAPADDRAARIRADRGGGGRAAARLGAAIAPAAAVRRGSRRGHPRRLRVGGPGALGDGRSRGPPTRRQAGGPDELPGAGCPADAGCAISRSPVSPPPSAPGWVRRPRPRRASGTAGSTSPAGSRRRSRSRWCGRRSTPTSPPPVPPR